MRCSWDFERLQSLDEAVGGCCRRLLKSLLSTPPFAISTSAFAILPWILVDELLAGFDMVFSGKRHRGLIICPCVVLQRHQDFVSNRIHGFMTKKRMCSIRNKASGYQEEDGPDLWLV